MYPIYCISFILNTIWYQEIADDGMLLFACKPELFVSPKPSFSKGIYWRVVL